jgi:hypothetical protein
MLVDIITVQGYSRTHSWFVKGMAGMTRWVLVIAAAIAWSGIAAAIISGSREPTSAVSAPVATKFDARWNDSTDVAADSFPLLKKTDRLPVPVVRSEEPGQIKTEIIATVQPDDRIDVKEKPPKKRKPTRMAEREVEHNVCTRYHMHKVTTHGGRSWRCRG